LGLGGDFQVRVGGEIGDPILHVVEGVRVVARNSVALRDVGISQVIAGSLNGMGLTNEAFV
jgi:hypothetical protein